MTHPHLAIFGYSEAAMFLRGSPAPDVVGIISIHGAREFGVEADAPHRLELRFDDIEVPVDGDLLSLQRVMSRKRFAEQNGLNEVAPAVADAEAIIRFAHEVRDAEGTILCHCGGGMSRAPAAALICLAVWRGAGAEAESMAHVRSVRQGAVPHAGLVRFADTLLNRGGALIRSVLQP